VDSSWSFLLLGQNLFDSIKREPFSIPEDDGSDLTHTFFNPDREGWLLKLGERLTCTRLHTCKQWLTHVYMLNTASRVGLAQHSSLPTLFIHLSICLSSQPFIHLPTYLSTHLPILSSLHPPTPPSAHLEKEGTVGKSEL
jgi:hypothetical protein